MWFLPMNLVVVSLVTVAVYGGGVLLLVYKVRCWEDHGRLFDDLGPEGPGGSTRSSRNFPVRTRTFGWTGSRRCCCTG